MLGFEKLETGLAFVYYSELVEVGFNTGFWCITVSLCFSLYVGSWYFLPPCTVLWYVCFIYFSSSLSPVSLYFFHSLSPLSSDLSILYCLCTIF